MLTPDTRYFQPRPSTATGYNPAATAFTNLGPNSKDARDTFKANLDGYLALERPLRPRPHRRGACPSTRSPARPRASIRTSPRPTPRSRRTASRAVRGLPLARVRQLIADNTDGRFLGVLGEPGVNVLELNLALDRLTAPMTAHRDPKPTRSTRASSGARARCSTARSWSRPPSTRCASSTRACRSATR